MVVHWGDQNVVSGGASSRPHGCRLWKSIMKQWPRFLNCIKWRLGRGDKIRFWLDRWVDEDSLQNRFPRIFELAQSKLLVVAEAYRVCSDRVEWSVNVTRHLNNWEIKEYENLLQILEAKNVKDSDQVIWELEKRGEFTVGSYYRFLKGGEEDGIHEFPIKQIWKTKVPPRVGFFAWEVCRESILTIDKLRTKGRL